MNNETVKDAVLGQGIYNLTHSTAREKFQDTQIQQTEKLNL